MTDRNEILDVLGGKTPVLFLVAGGLMIVFAVNTYLKTFVGTSYPVVQGVVAPVGFFVGVVGLFGLYAGNAERAPPLTRVAVVVAVVAGVGWLVIIAASIVSQGEPGGLLAILPILVIMSMILSFALFGVSSFRSGSYSPIVSVLLVVEAVMFLLVIVGVPGYLIDTGHVLAYLGIGITLWTTGVPADTADSTHDSPV